MRKQLSRSSFRIACAVILAACLSLGPLSVAGSSPLQNTSTNASYVLQPRALQRGKTHEILLQTDPAASLGTNVSDIQLSVFLNGSEIVVPDQDKELVNENKGLLFRLAIPPGADLGTANFKIKRGGSTSIIALDIREQQPAPPLPQQPTPSNMSQVDVMWHVVPPTITRENFGRRIAEKYYCIAVHVGNNTGYGIQLTGIGFESTFSSPNQPPSSGETALLIPTVSYRMARGTVEREQQTGFRNISLNLLRSTALLATGFSPYFRAANAARNFSTITSVFGNQLTSGYETVFPDTTINHLRRLGDAPVLHDSMTISNNTQRVLIAFFPREFIDRPNPAQALNSDQAQDQTQQSDGRNRSRDRARNRNQRTGGNNPDMIAVMRTLGQIVLIGQVVPATNRFVVTSTNGNLTNNGNNNLTPFGATAEAARAPRTGELVINEVGIAGLDSTGASLPAGTNFIELHNLTNQRLDLSDLTVSYRARNSGATIDLKLPSGAVVEPNGYFLISNAPSIGLRQPSFRVHLDLNMELGGVAVARENERLDVLAYRSNTVTTAPPEKFQGGEILPFPAANNLNIRRTPDGTGNFRVVTDLNSSSPGRTN